MYTANTGTRASARKVTVPEIRARKAGPKVSMVTAYDYTMARLVDEDVLAANASPAIGFDSQQPSTWSSFDRSLCKN